jgi:hypothetical protein
MTSVMFKTTRSEVTTFIYKVSEWLESNVPDGDWRFVNWRNYPRSNHWIEGVEFENEADAMAFKLQFTL